jgi:Arc/MetJ-type ribon-helix-helix transcriptional regulator
MNVSTEPELAKFIEEQVRAGRYASADAAVNAASLWLKAEQEVLAGEFDDKDVAATNEGLAQLDRGECLSWDKCERSASPCRL